MAVATEKPGAADLEPNLKLAIHRDPGNDSANIKYGDFLKKSGNTTAALEHLEQTSFGNNHWLGWQRRAELLTRMASMPGGNQSYSNEAAALYDKVLRVHPENRTALEHRAQLALQEKDWTLVGSLADRIELADYNNLSADYLRAMLAKELGQTSKSQHLLTSLIQRKGRGSTLFTKQDLQREARLLNDAVLP